MRKPVIVLLFAVVLTALGSAGALAHFGMVIPSEQMLSEKSQKQVHIDLLFWHPFENKGMDLAKPAAFGVVAAGKKSDLLATLKEKKVGGNQAWETDYKIERPGLYVFYLEPTPYWEPAEDKFIVHITKACVAAFGDDEGWDKPIGLKAEIVPISKPYGLYAGNVFQGRVFWQGQPVPWAEVEIEYYTEKGQGQAPNDLMVTQTIKADANGVFTYAAPKAGWWGFAALKTDSKKIKHEGKDREVEVGAVIWVKFHEMK
ncbi:MAG: DUF4198 domain-containing protein [Thermodesulfobacteriota bacterium]